jgi:5-methylcytosine-specific restriction protein A
MAQVDRWSDDELRSSVKAYIEIRNLQMQGETVNKAAVYRLLEQQHGRTAKSFEYRMQNISHVYALMGRSWAAGLKPARNVGTETAAKLEELIHLEEGTPTPPVVAFEQEVLEALKRKPKQAPVGQGKPRTRELISTQYDRDNAVVAWVRQEANGVCECCQSPAPFIKQTGDPYLEVHHLRRLADGGSDRVSNAAAICPNCHRELHLGVNAGELLKRLYANLQRLVPE